MKVTQSSQEKTYHVNLDITFIFTGQVNLITLLQKQELLLSNCYNNFGSKKNLLVWLVLKLRIPKMFKEPKFTIISFCVLDILLLLPVLNTPKFFLISFPFGQRGKCDLLLGPVLHNCLLLLSQYLFQELIAAWVITRREGYLSLFPHKPE